MKKQIIKGFTLVELIIVITILAILATISFISFQGHSKNSRDSNRLSTLTAIKKGLDIYSIQAGIFPEPDGTLLSGSLNGVQLIKLGIIGDNISRLIKLNKTPTDIVLGNNYSYGVSADNKYYQIGATMENLESYNPIINSTYADNGSYKAKVIGNYKYPLKYNGKIYTLPSLLFTGSGGDLSLTGNYFVIDGGQNIPYHPNGVLNNTRDSTQLLQVIIGTGGITLTGITQPSITSDEFKNLTSTSATIQSLQQALGITDKDKLGIIVYGINYLGNTSINATSNSAPVYSSCSFSGNTVAHGTSVIAYQTNSVSYGNTCTSEQRTCTNGILSGSYTYSSCTVAGATGTFTLSSTGVTTGTPVTISNNCSTAPTSYTSSNTSVATVSGNTITTISAGTTNITPVGGACSDSNAKSLTVTPPNSCVTPTPSGVGVASTTVGTPTSINQAWQSTNSGNPCYYSCNANYSGVNCVTYTPPPNSCNSTQPTNATLTAGTPTSVNQARQTSDLAQPCHFVCNSGYGFNGTSCVTATNCASGIDYITISNGQSWACKNLGATTVWDGTTQPANCGNVSTTNCNSFNWIGDYYQWGRNDTGFTIGQAGWGYDWQTPQVNNAWGGSTSDSPTSDGGGTTKVGRKGPCPNGYHVPSAKEFQDMCNTIVGSTCTNAMGYNSNIATKLRIPFGGNRSPTNGYYNQGGGVVNLWSSSPSGTNAYDFYLGYNSSIYQSYSDSRANGGNVRCIKN